MPKQKRTFQIEVEAKLVVKAFDEASARKKVERALSANKAIDPDVHATGDVWTYHVAPHGAEVETA